MWCASGAGGMICLVVVGGAEGVGHGMGGPAGLTFDVDIRWLSRYASFIHVEGGPGTVFPSMHKMMPGEVVEMSGGAGDHEARRDNQRLVGVLGTHFVPIAGFFRMIFVRL